MPAAEPLPFGDDVALLLQASARMVSEEMMRDLVKVGLDDVRESDGYVFQHLREGPRTISDLAERLGITQQGASKAVADLARRGYVEVRPDQHDGRAKAVALTDQGWKVIRRGRTTRARLGREVDDALGARRARELRRALAEVATVLGAFDALDHRRLRPPT